MVYSCLAKHLEKYGRNLNCCIISLFGLLVMDESEASIVSSMSSFFAVINGVQVKN